MKKGYETPAAQPILLAPSQTVASEITWDVIISGDCGEDPQRAANTSTGDIKIKI